VSKATDPRQVSLLPPDAAAILHLVRENLGVLRELALRYEIPWLDGVTRGPQLSSPEAVASYVGPEMADLAQEQLRVVLLDNKNRVVAAQLVYQGGINAVTVRIADCFREAVRAGAAGLVLVHNV
jgi:DNA repair protein RadC